ncbi:MAG: prohibitin family protein [Bacteroidota bacterium]
MANPYPNLTRTAGRYGVVALFVFILLVIAAGCMTASVGSGEQGVKVSLLSGTNLERSFGEGFHIFWPWESMTIYDVTLKNRDEKVEVLSSNGLEIAMDVSVRYRPDLANLPQLHVTFGRDYYEDLIQPEIRSESRAAVGRFTPEELYSTRRDELQQQITSRLSETADSVFIDIDAVLIRDVELPQQIRSAIENKLEEEQRVEQTRLSIQVAEQEANRKRVEAQGQADYQRIITESLSDRFLQFEGIQATRQLAESPNAKVVVVGGGDSGLPLILGDN